MGDPRILTMKGDDYFEQQRYSEACDSYTEAIDADMAAGFAEGMHFSSALYCGRAACHLALVDYSVALLDATCAVQLDKNNAKAHLSRSRALIGLIRYEEALECLERAQ